MKCSLNFNDEERQRLFNNYWNNLSILQRKEVTLKNIEKPTTGTESRRSYTRDYYIPTENGETKKMCLSFVLKFLRYTLLNATVLNAAKNDARGSKSPKNKTLLRCKKTVHTFIESLPTADSH